MFTINQYQSIKIDGTWNDLFQYVRSLSAKDEFENYLKQSSSYEDLKVLIFLSKSTKNAKNLLQIFQTASLPIKQRAIAGKGWLKIQTDEKLIHHFIIDMIADRNIPRFLKNQIFDHLHRIDCLKKSPTFFDHHQSNIDAYLLPFCSKDQIVHLLSQWSIQRFEQIPSPSLLRSRLIHHQPAIVLQLIQSDLNERRDNPTYFRVNNQLFALLAKKEAKAVCRLIIDYLKQLEKHQRILPNFLHSNQKYFFKKTPEEMIELITLAGSNEPGTLKYQIHWDNQGYDFQTFTFPRSFSLQHYIRLFLALYETCQWSANHTLRIFQYMLSSHDQHSGLSSIRKQRKWLIEVVIDQHIGREVFLEKLLAEGDETTLKLFEDYTEITTPLSLHLISQYEANKPLSNKQRLGLIRYQTMTSEIFNEFVTLFTQTSWNINQREANYLIFLQSALSTSAEQVKNVLQWIAKRFSNERLPIIEYFLQHFNDLNHLQILPENFEIVESIVQLALHHRQQSTHTLQILFDYALQLLKRVEHYRNETIQTFATRIIKQCFSKANVVQLYIQPISRLYPITRELLSDLLVSDLFPKLLSKSMIGQLNDILDVSLEQSWRLPRIDSFLQTFFLDHLPSAFRIDTHASIISIFLKNRSTQFERVQHLVENINRIFLLNESAQRIILKYGQHRTLIDQLLQDGTCLTPDKLAKNATMDLQTESKSIKIPGFDISILKSSFRYLTGKQQEYITKIILYDFLQDKEIINPKKLKSLRVLCRLAHTYNQSLHWFEQRQNSPPLKESTTGVNIDPLDPIVICLPVRFDLTPEEFLKQLKFLMMKLNASNAKYISDTMRMISFRISERIFLEEYLHFVQSEQFQKLGITANKEVLRLLTEYSSDSSLIRSVIQPLWTSRPHQDVRACLIFTLLYFLEKMPDQDDEKILWEILQQAADDPYLLVVQSLFANCPRNAHWPLTRLITMSKETFQKFVNEIQFRILDHPTSLEARLWAWSNIDDEHCDFQKLSDKGQRLCTQFHRDANTLWENAFQRILSSHQQRTIPPLNVIVNILQTLMSQREEMDSKENGIDHQHDLPVYHRIHRIVTIVISRIPRYDTESKYSFRSLADILLQFDKTFALLVGKLLIKIAQNRDDLQSMLCLLEKNLSEDYFERILTELGKIIAEKYSETFIQRLDHEEKLQLARWFIEEQDRGLFVFELLKTHVFNQSKIDREQCQNLLRRIRQSDNLVLKQQAMEYTVRWKRKKERGSRKKIRSDAPRVAANNIDDCSDDLFDIFDTVQSA